MTSPRPALPRRSRSRLWTVLTVLLGAVLPPLGVSPLTSWMLVPGHLVFCVVVSFVALGAGWDGESDLARRWGGFSLGVLVLAVAGIELGQRLGAPTAWVSWTLMLAWGWAPPVVSAAAGAIGGVRRRRLDRIARPRRARGA